MEADRKAKEAARQREWCAKNREAVRERSRKWKEANKAKIQEYNKKWQEGNKAYKAAHEGRRTAQKRKATPAWADQSKILAIYAQAAEMTETTKVKYEVDHIVPLTSDIVCGLHCEANLRVITKTENSSKRNFHWEGMW